MNAKPLSETALRDEWTHDPDYRRYFQKDEDIEEILDLLALDKVSSLVDVGCGNGAFAKAAARRFPSCQVRAFDALDSAVACCRAAAGKLSNLQAEVAWAHSIPLPNSSADRVLFRAVLHHVAEPGAVYSEISRLLKPGGRLVLQAPCNNWEASFAEVLSELMMLVDDSHPRFYYRPTEIVAGLEGAGLSARRPQCWTYSMVPVEEAQVRLVQQRNAADKLQLHRMDNGKWSLEGYWVRIVAEKPRVSSAET